MANQFLKNTVKISLVFFSLVMALSTAFAAEPTLDASSAKSEIKNEKVDESMISLSELATRTEQGLKTKILVGRDLANYKIHVNLGKESLSYGQLLSQLNANGFTAFKSKDYIQIIVNRDARNMAIPVVSKNGSYLEDEYVTDYLKVEKACAGKLLAVLRPLVPQYGHMANYDDAHLLVVVDTYGNIQRLKLLVKEIEENLDAKQNCGDSKKD
jgi:type II secretory pathway component GspD/PulD (secretin)